MQGNFTDLEEESSSLMTTLNQNKKEFIEQTIVNIFENKILSYFDGIPKLDFNIQENRNFFNKYYRNSKNKTQIVFDLSFEIFKDCINKLDTIYEIIKIMK